MAGNSWIQKAEENLELFSNAGRGAEAARMLEIAPSNRILIDRDQAIIMQISRLMENRFANLKPPKGIGLIVPGAAAEPVKVKVNKYQWVKDLLDNVELHQATIEAKTREDFKQVAIAQGIGMANKLKGELVNLAVK